jgi:hypothetical protein
MGLSVQGGSSLGREPLAIGHKRTREATQPVETSAPAPLTSAISCAVRSTGDVLETSK